MPEFTTDGGKTLTYPGAPGLTTSRMALGCMHHGGSWNLGADISTEARMRATAAIEVALELGWNFFDHADIYGRGRSELLFGELMADMGIQREAVILQSKCGICLPAQPSEALTRWYDFSSRHIVDSVDGSLKRLQTDYLDILLLHRPDFLMEPDDLLEAFEKLRTSGKVLHFGVSNFTPPLLELVRAAGFTPVANQVQINPLKTSLLDGTMVSREGEPTTGHVADGTLEWHRVHGVVTQAWAPLAYGYLSGRDVDPENEAVVKAAEAVLDIADSHDVSTEAIVIAWLLRHPARIQPVIGTRDPARLRACHEGLSVNLTREDWYRIYQAGSGSCIP